MQTYRDGAIVRWIGAPDSEHPASVTTSSSAVRARERRRRGKRKRWWCGAGRRSACGARTKRRQRRNRLACACAGGGSTVRGCGGRVRGTASALGDVTGKPHDVTSRAGRPTNAPKRSAAARRAAPWCSFGGTSSTASIVTSRRARRRVQPPTVTPSMTIGRDQQLVRRAPVGVDVAQVAVGDASARRRCRAGARPAARPTAVGRRRRADPERPVGVPPPPRARSPHAATPARPSAIVSPDHQAKSRSVAGPWLVK